MLVDRPVAECYDAKADDHTEDDEGFLERDESAAHLPTSQVPRQHWEGVRVVGVIEGVYIGRSDLGNV